MKCLKCGKNLRIGSLFCSNCGTPICDELVTYNSSDYVPILEKKIGSIKHFYLGKDPTVKNNRIEWFFTSQAEDVLNICNDNYDRMLKVLDEKTVGQLYKDTLQQLSANLIHLDSKSFYSSNFFLTLLVQYHENKNIDVFDYTLDTYKDKNNNPILDAFLWNTDSLVIKSLCKWSHGWYFGDDPDFDLSFPNIVDINGNPLLRFVYRLNSEDENNLIYKFKLIYYINCMDKGIEPKDDWLFNKHLFEDDDLQISEVKDIIYNNAVYADCCNFGI